VADIKVGMILDETSKRDAIHIAIAPVVAAHILVPGERVGFVSREEGTVGRIPPTIGIVDPFLTEAVMPGQRFFVFLQPQTITSLRHEWTHPAFDDVAPPVEQPIDLRSAAFGWLDNFARREGMTVHELLAMMADAVRDGYIGETSRWNGVEFDDEFWDNYERATGTKVAKRHQYFSCSC
jgi:hypothetical protein